MNFLLKCVLVLVLSVSGLAPAGEVTVTVPAEAAIFFNGSPTTQTGEIRTFNYDDSQLAQGSTYTYTIKAVMPDGRSQEKQVPVLAGGSASVEFKFASTQPGISNNVFERMAEMYSQSEPYSLPQASTSLSMVCSRSDQPTAIHERTFEINVTSEGDPLIGHKTIVKLSANIERITATEKLVNVDGNTGCTMSNSWRERQEGQGRFPDGSSTPDYYDYSSADVDLRLRTTQPLGPDKDTFTVVYFVYNYAYYEVADVQEYGPDHKDTYKEYCYVKNRKP